MQNATDDQFEVIEISNLNQLRLFLQNPETNQYYKSFDNIQRQLKSCEQLTFCNECRYVSFWLLSSWAIY